MHIAHLYQCRERVTALHHVAGIGDGICVSEMFKSRKENPQKLTQLSSRSHPRHLVGKRTAQKDITIDTINF